MNSLIKCEHMDLGYDDRDAVIDLSMEIDPGDYLCIVGENGSGKTTLIKGLLGLLKPTAGTLTVSPEIRNGGIGYLPQQTAAQRDFPASVYEVVLSGCLGMKGARPFYSRKEKERAVAGMRKLGIVDLKKRCYRELSGGQQQRVLIARALCATDRLLILDEPVTGLDPAAIREFYDMIRRLNREEGVTILMVSHDVRGVVEEAGKILHLDQRPLYYGPADQYEKSRAGSLFCGKPPSLRSAGSGGGET